MPSAKAVLKKIDISPWYEWVEEFESKDDNGRDGKFDDIQTSRARASELDKWHESLYEVRTDDTSEDRGIEGEL